MAINRDESAMSSGIRLLRAILVSCSNFNLTDFLIKYMCVKEDVAKLVNDAISTLSPKYQAYFARFAATLNPNGLSEDPPSGTPIWKPASVTSDGDKLSQAMDVSLISFNADFTDQINTNQICGFWTEVSYNISKLIRRQRQGRWKEIGPDRGLSVDLQEPL